MKAQKPSLEIIKHENHRKQNGLISCSRVDNSVNLYFLRIFYGTHKKQYTFERWY